jgi:Kdo2-lipid IVA lauroyltransferase/acyltransferase
MSNLPEIFALCLVKAVGRLPLAAARRLGCSLGQLALWLNAPMVKVTRRNIAHCLPELTPAEQARLVRASVLETAQLACESCVIWRYSNAQLEAMIESVEGLEQVQALLARGQGLLILGPHLGNWEVLGRYITRLGPVTSMFQPPKMPRFGALVKQGREQSGARLVATDRRGLTAVLNALRQGGISGVLPDQTPKEAVSGQHAAFFGQPAFTMTLVYRLLQNAQCQAVFAYAKRTARGFGIVFVPAPEALYSADMGESLAALNAGVECCVRQCPEQYQWEYKRFKRHGSGQGIYG